MPFHFPNSTAMNPETTPSRPLEERRGEMSHGCFDVRCLSAGFILDKEEVPVEQIRTWLDDLSTATYRLERLLRIREAAEEEARYLAMEAEAAA